ncbi:polyphosphate--glucose phosphotransferase [Streptomyces zingiberis]|uniref:ROK family protein n=1 Tax=Streptomyces zingiberis TaxID=2053010 RepID=A0ABX1BRW5_9ACTN|nr:ROK family protein [Streptomyces zingiberis]NJQ00471.1 ROK family protein [Streptomyces zingiberis]
MAATSGTQPAESQRPQTSGAAPSAGRDAGSAAPAPKVATAPAPGAAGARPRPVLGVDIGGSGIKGAPVDLGRGDLAEERHKVLTPRPATPEAVVECVAEVVGHFAWTRPLGVTFPGVVTDGTTRTAANVDPGWIGRDTRALLADRLGLPVTVLNDADAAGVAEMAFGAGRGRRGTVIVLTLGTGIGSAVFTDGHLVPNTELGHLELDGHDAETRAAGRVKDEEGMKWAQWSRRLERYLRHVEMLFSPELFILGGGISRKAHKFLPRIEGVRAEMVPAELKNNAGIVGAAMTAAAAAR